MMSSVTERATIRLRGCCGGRAIASATAVSTLRHVFAAALVLAASTAFAQAGRGQAPAPADIPPQPLSALAPSNIAKARPPAPFDLTGNWFIQGGVQGWLFGRTANVLPKLTPAAQKHFDAYTQATKEGKVYRDDIGKCWPAGMPIIMTRVWPIAMIQKPTAIYMVSGFMNSFRTIFLDGRKHTDPDIVVRTFNGESIGRWEGDTLVVDTRHFTDLPYHWVDQGIPASPDFRMIERYKLINDGKVLEGEWTLIDPQNWEGEWKGVRRWNRVDDIDIEEVSCLPDLNEHLQSTSSKVHVN
jgi:hypothetical protein